MLRAASGNAVSIMPQILSNDVEDSSDIAVVAGALGTYSNGVCTLSIGPFTHAKWAPSSDMWIGVSDEIGDWDYE